MALRSCFLRQDLSLWSCESSRRDTMTRHIHRQKYRDSRDASVVFIFAAFDWSSPLSIICTPLLPLCVPLCPSRSASRSSPLSWWGRRFSSLCLLQLAWFSFGQRHERVLVIGTSSTVNCRFTLCVDVTRLFCLTVTVAASQASSLAPLKDDVWHKVLKGLLLFFTD